MTPLLLDASAWLAALDDKDVTQGGAVLSLVAANEAGAVELGALDLTLYEVGNVASIRWPDREIAAPAVSWIDRCCGPDLIRIDARLAHDAIAIAAEHGLTVYDAAYVAAARERGWTLVSCDHADLVRPGLAVTPETVLRDA